MSKLNKMIEFKAYYSLQKLNEFLKENGITKDKIINLQFDQGTRQHMVYYHIN